MSYSNYAEMLKSKIVAASIRGEAMIRDNPKSAPAPKKIGKAFGVDSDIEKALFIADKDIENQYE